MTLTLILTRHAKSSWSNDTLDDFDRPLNARGKRSVTAIGDWLARKDYHPDEAIVSTARRTRETWSGIAAQLPGSAPMHASQALYLASADTMLAELRRASSPITMLIGHNPGIASFASQIVQAPGHHPRFRDYPTGATSVIRFDAHYWREVEWRTGTLIDFTVPRDLEE